jgi:hypothetical protein
VEKRMLKKTAFCLFWRAAVDIGDRSVILFAVEHKKATGEASANRLAYDLSTALSHRRALGMPDASLYGATCDDGKFTLYEARWSLNELDNTKEVTTFPLPCPFTELSVFQGIAVIPQKVWDVRIFEDLIGLYSVLRFIAAELRYPIEEFNKAEVDLSTFSQKDWRASAQDRCNCGGHNTDKDDDNGSDANTKRDNTGGCDRSGASGGSHGNNRGNDSEGPERKRQRIGMS